MKLAMKAKAQLRLDTIRMMRTAIKNKEIETGGELSDSDVISVLSTLMKQRRESAQVFRDNDRVEMAEKEEAELLVIQEFLPAQLDANALRELVIQAIAASGATSLRDMGAVMKLVAPQTVGRADGRVVSEMVKAQLTS
ncbi:MAG: GatB/YqeY domain-containing protein [Desulfuromonadaceae bacterium]|nr:GatB/YqeY domain-containing protein [Desulfuromonadaceae bacterium]